MTSRFFGFRRAACAALALLLCAAANAQTVRLRAGQRTITTDRCQVVVQKNGQVNVAFASGELICENALPAVLLAGKEKAESLGLRAEDAERMTVSDPLGQGQGFIFAGEGGEWHIRTYPGKPFLTVRTVYRNTGKKPVRVARLSPWTVGTLRKGACLLGPEAARTLVLDNGSLFRDFNDYARVTRGGAEHAGWNLAAHNPVSGRSLIAGFLTHERAWTELSLTRGEEAAENAFDRLSCDCVYDPPLEVAPGGELASETLYVAMAETNPLTGLDRFGRAAAAVNGVPGAPAFLPHGWDPWSAKFHKDINEQNMLENLDALDRTLKPHGWTHFALDAGWERGLGDWEAHPEKFPRGMKFMADEIHRRGMTASLWISPFAVARNSETAKGHPDWLVEPRPGVGRMLVGGDTLLLDVTKPEVREHIAGVARRITEEWGYDAIVEADFVYFLLMAKPNPGDNLTDVERLRLGMEALRAGMRKGAFLLTMTPQPVNGVLAEGVRTGRDCDPVWKSDNLQKNWGAVDTLTNTIRRFYVAPHLYLPDQDCAFFGHEATMRRWNALDKPRLTRDQSIAWLTGAALTGGVVKIGDAFADLTPDQIDILRRLLPVPPNPARPLDLFQEESPAVWFLPLRNGGEKWYLLALFNWATDAPRTHDISLAALGLDAKAYYTVYDFWAGRYLGRASGALQAETAPASVRLFGLRPDEGRPQFVASDNHLCMGALDQRGLAWDPASGMLSGAFNTVAGAPHTLTFLCPDPWRPGEALVSGAPAPLVQDGPAVTLRFTPADTGETRWSVSFTR